MKTRLLLCGAALLLAGCASEPNRFAPIAQQTYVFDWVEEPFPDLSPPQINSLYYGTTTPTASAVLFNAVPGSTGAPTH